MSRFTAKLAFVHRSLWQRDPAYRWAVLLGPPPLIGCALAALFWAAIQQTAAPAPGDDTPWAQWTRPAAQEGQPFVEPPTAPLPQTDASGRFVGFQPGWQGTIQPMAVDATMDPNVIGSVLSRFTLDQPAIPLARILDAGPPSGLFVGGAKAFFVVQAPGAYAFSVRLTRASPQSADCLVRFASARHSMVRHVSINMNGTAVLTYPAVQFQLQPGLLLLQAAVGCWRGDRMVGPGELTVMVRHPGDAALQPVAADELIRPAPHTTAGR